MFSLCLDESVKVSVKVHENLGGEKNFHQTLWLKLNDKLTLESRQRLSSEKKSARTFNSKHFTPKSINDSDIFVKFQNETH